MRKLHSLNRRPGQSRTPTGLLLPLFGLLLLAASAVTYPRLAAEQGAPCQQCHINPTGGGARNEFGNYSVALNELTLQSTKKMMLERYRSPRIADALLFGFDVRHLVFESGRIFRMQTDAFLTVEPFDNLYYHLRLSEIGVVENYGLMTFDHQKYSFKIGRFYPTYGLRNIDHNAFNRERIGWGPRLFLDGVSASVEFDGFYTTLEYFNPNEQSVGIGHIYRPGYIAPFGYLVGASYRWSEEINGSHGQFPHARALFGGLSWKRFTGLAEVDLVGKSNDTLVFYGSLTTRIIYGLWAIAEYNYLDPDREFETGIEEFARFSIEFYPIPFVELRPSYTRYTRGLRAGEDDFFVQFHVGY